MEIELIDKHEFVEAAFNEVSETFVVYMATLKVLVSIIIMYPTIKPTLAVLE